MYFILSGKIKNDYLFDIPIFELNDNTSQKWPNIPKDKPIAIIKQGKKDEYGFLEPGEVSLNSIVLYLMGVGKIIISRCNPEAFNYIPFFYLKGERPEGRGFDSCISIRYFDKVIVMRYDKINESLLPTLTIDRLGILHLDPSFFTIRNIEIGKSTIKSFKS